jgi:hypothetical protein
MCSTDGKTEPWQALHSAAESLAAEDVTGWSDDQVRGGLLTLLSVMNQLNAVASTLSASFDTRCPRTLKMSMPALFVVSMPVT